MLNKHVAHLLVVWSVSTAVAVLAQTSGSSSHGRQPADAPSELRKLKGADAKQASKLRKAIIDAEKADRWADAVAAAEQALALRTRAQGAEHYLTIDADWKLKTLHRIAAMSREERAVVKAEGRHRQARPGFISGEEICRRAALA